MGCSGIGFSKSSYDTLSNGKKFGVSKSKYDKDDFVYASGVSYQPKLPNPDPYNFVIKKYYAKNSYLVVMINYPDCTNYEGNKILVFRDLSIDKLKTFKSIDPHFSNSIDFKSPIARFEPTNDGWMWAVKFIEGLHSKI